MLVHRCPAGRRRKVRKSSSMTKAMFRNLVVWLSAVICRQPGFFQYNVQIKALQKSIRVFT